MSDEQFRLNERGEARQKSDLLREARRARASEKRLAEVVNRLMLVAPDKSIPEDIWRQAHAALSEVES